MSILNTHTKRDALNETLYNVVEEYLNEKELHLTETVLGISKIFFIVTHINDFIPKYKLPPKWIITKKYREMIL